MSLSPVLFSNHILTCLEKIDQRQSFDSNNDDVYNQLMSSIDSLSNPYACNHRPLSDSERYVTYYISDNSSSLMSFIIILLV